MNEPKFPNRLKWARDEHNTMRLNSGLEPLTQVGLAKAVGVSRTTIAKIESELAEPGVGLALRICRAISNTDVWDVFPLPRDAVQMPPNRTRTRSPETISR